MEEGDRIEKGQPFLHLEREAYIAERDRWAAQLRRAQTEVQQSEVSLADARLKLGRARRLQTEGIITREQLDSTERRLRMVKGQAAKARRFRELDDEYTALRLALAFDQYDDIRQRLDVGPHHPFAVPLPLWGRNGGVAIA